MFWVGLMDSNGLIQVNHWKYLNLQYRLIIKLENLKSNYNMLILISKIIGGSVKIIENKKFIIWIVNDKKEIEKIIKIFDKYPLLTIRKNNQLSFLKECLKNNNIENYFKNRELKYNNSNRLININSILKSKYFKSWISGYIESEGNFIIRKNKNISFKISQKNEKWILEWMKENYKIKSMIRKSKDNIYSIETYDKIKIKEIIKHFNKFPLLGFKNESLNNFIGVLNN